MQTGSSSVGEADLDGIRKALAAVPGLFRTAQAAIFPGTSRQAPVSGTAPVDPAREHDRLWNARQGLPRSGEQAAPARVAALQTVIDVEQRMAELRNAVGNWAARSASVRVTTAVAQIAAAQRVDESCGWIREHLDAVPATQRVWVMERLLGVQQQLAAVVDPEPEVVKVEGVCPRCHCRSLVMVTFGSEKRVVCRMNGCKASWVWTRGAV